MGHTEGAAPARGRGFRREHPIRSGEVPRRHLRSTTGAEIQVIMPDINAPFRLIFGYNALRVDRNYFGIANGQPFQIKDPGKAIKFTVGKTF
jgi:hypothetical protein